MNGSVHPRNVEYLHELNSRGRDWIWAGVWNMAFAQLDKSGWLHRVRGVLREPNATTCRKELPGTTIDLQFVSKNLYLTFVPGAVVDETAATWPCRPVRISMLDRPRAAWTRVAAHPRALPRQPLPGCVIKKAPGAKVGIIWKTGLLPSANHGAAVNGVSDTALQQLRATAGLVVGARPASSLTSPLLMGRRGNCDPVLGATTSILLMYSGFIWERRVQLGRLQRAWLELKIDF